MSEKSPERIVQEAARIDQFLRDDVVGGALQRMERRYYEEFLAADSSEARVKAWAKANVLRDLEGQMKSLVDAGEFEILQMAKAAKREQPRK